MNKFPLLVHCVIILAIGFLLTGCLFSKPTNSDIVGLWVESSSDKDNAQSCGTIEFFDDGTFEAKNIPGKYFMPSIYRKEENSPERFEASGTWELDTSSNDPFAVHQVELDFAPLEGIPLGFDVAIYIPLGGSGDALYAGIDNTVFFHKGEKCE